MLNEHQQQQIRQESIDELVHFATPESIGALVKRLGVNFRDTIKNEQEKRYVADVLVEHFGPDSIEPMIHHIRTQRTISSVILTLGRIMPADKVVLILLETLAQYPPNDHRYIEPRLQLVDALADHDHADIMTAFTPYVMDHDDNVRIKVMDVIENRLSKTHPQYDNVIDALVDVLKDPHASGRITRRAATIFDNMDTNLSKRVDELADYVPDGYTLGSNGRMSKA